MSSSFNSGGYKIISLTEGRRAASIAEPYYPGGPPFQTVRLGLPVDTWQFKKVGSAGVYRLFGLGGYSYTGVKDDKVIVSIDSKDEREWFITRVEEEGAFVIGLGAEQGVWTVSAEKSPNPTIEINPVKTPYQPDQLFFIELVDE